MTQRVPAAETKRMEVLLLAGREAEVRGGLLSSFWIY